MPGRPAFRGSLPHPLEAEAYIVSEFGRGGVSYRTKPHDFKLNCPFPHPKGADRGYHLEIRKDGTRAHCWVCDWSGSWNKLAPALGLAPFGNNAYAGTYTARMANADVFGNLSKEFGTVIASQKAELPSSITPWKSDWRGLSLDFLSSIPSYSWSQDSHEGAIPRILWPYFQLGKLVGYAGRRLDRLPAQRYYRAGWCKASKVLFPFDFVASEFPSAPYVVLVEGEFDALNLISHGVPALATLGSTNWSNHKRDLVIHSGVSHVYLMMDPDGAGKHAKVKLKRELSSYISVVKSVKLDTGTDPGDLSSDDVSWLKTNVFPTLP